jgi:hypothetical protein
MWQTFFLVLATNFCAHFFQAKDSQCVDRNLGRIEFQKGSAKLTNKAEGKLDSLVIIINNYSACQILTTSHSSDLCDKCGALSWDRTKAVVDYLLHKGITAGRITSSTELDGNLDFVSLAITSRSLTELPVQHPNLKKQRNH